MSGINRPTRGNIKPEKHSCITKAVDPPGWGVSSKVRTPLKSGANPPLHVMRVSGTTFETCGVNVRAVPGTWIRIRWPSRISPSIAVTVEFQR